MAELPLMFYPLELEVSSNAKESVFPLFLCLGALALNSRKHCQMRKDYTDTKKDQTQSGSGIFSAVPKEPGNFLVLLPRLLETKPAGVVGSRWV